MIAVGIILSLAWELSAGQATTPPGPIAATKSSAPSPLVTVSEFNRAAATELQYAFEHGDLVFEDRVILSNGDVLLGKAMEWADRVLVFGADGAAQALESTAVERVEFHRYERHRRIPGKPDLTVAFVERIPRDASLHGHARIEDGLLHFDADPAKANLRLKPGTNVAFRIHILNAGGAPSERAVCRVLIDGAQVHEAPVDALQPRGGQVVEARWQWQEGPHALRVELTGPGAEDEINRWNNTHEEQIAAQPVTVVVAKDRYARFAAARNLVDSYCFEDWIQYQLRCLNGLFAASVSAAAPRGVIERVRCDRIVVFEDTHDAELREAWNASLRREGKPDGLTEYAALTVLHADNDAGDEVFGGLSVDWEMLKDVCLQLGLVDWSLLDTAPDQCLAADRHGRYVERRHLFPRAQTLMYHPGGFRLTAPEAAYLNHVAGKPRGARGEFLHALPKRITLVVHANDGRPLESVQIDAYQLQSTEHDPRFIMGVSPRDPLYSAPTDATGRLTLLDQSGQTGETLNGYGMRPNPFGVIAPNGSNGLLLLKLQQGPSEEFHFLRLFDCISAALSGDVEEHVVDIRTRFGGPEAPPPTPTTAMISDDRKSPLPRVVAAWFAPPGYSSKQIDEFRIYKRSSLGGDDASPWRLVGINDRRIGPWWLRFECTYWDRALSNPDYSLDTFYAVSLVDRQGRESGLSAPGCLIRGKESVKLAILRDHAVITLIGDGPVQLIRWDGDVGSQPFGVRNLEVPGYRPAFAGVAYHSDGRLLMTDPVNHVLAFYNDQAELTEVVPRRPMWPGFPSDEPGEFYTPWDVAVDPAGRIYVADFGNNRVQILDASARFAGLLDEEANFRGPSAVGYANGHLCVTDRDGTRVRVYDVSGDQPRLVRRLPPIIDADRALVSKSGKIYVTGRLVEKLDNGILVFVPDETDGVHYDRLIEASEMGKLHAPRGLHFFVSDAGIDFGYCVNSFPFDVRRQHLE